MCACFCETNPVIKYERCGVTLRVMFKARKVQFGHLLSILANISETVHAMSNVSIEHIYKLLYNISFYTKTFDLRLRSPLKVK